MLKHEGNFASWRDYAMTATHYNWGKPVEQKGSSRQVSFSGIVHTFPEGTHFRLIHEIGAIKLAMASNGKVETTIKLIVLAQDQYGRVIFSAVTRIEQSLAVNQEDAAKLKRYDLATWQLIRSRLTRAVRFHVIRKSGVRASFEAMQKQGRFCADKLARVFPKNICCRHDRRALAD